MAQDNKSQSNNKDVISLDDSPANSELSWDINIPAVVLLCHEIEMGARLLYGVIRGLTRSKGYCFATNAYLGDLMQVDPSTVKRWLASLKEKKFIQVELETTDYRTARKIFLTDLISLVRQSSGGVQNCPGGGSKMIGGGCENEPHNTIRECSILSSPLTPQSGEISAAQDEDFSTSSKGNSRSSGLNPRALGTAPRQIASKTEDINEVWVEQLRRSPNRPNGFHVDILSGQEGNRAVRLAYSGAELLFPLNMANPQQQLIQFMADVKKRRTNKIV